jgi:dipeptidyl aminopeptidase/acylaminoacyl peptidase
VKSLLPYRFAVLIAILAAVAALLVSCSAPEPPLIPKSVLLGNPQKLNPKLSPDGTMLAYMASVMGVENVWVGQNDGSNAKPVTKARLREVKDYFWSMDSRRILYLQDADGDENWRIYSIDIQTQETRDLTPFPGVQALVFADSRNHPDELLIKLNKDDPGLYDAFRLNQITGEMSLAAKNMGSVTDWYADTDLQVRAAVASNDQAGSDLMVRKSERDPWTRLLTWDADDALSSGVIDFSADGRSLYLIDAREANAGRLVRIDIATGATEVLAEDPLYDVGDVFSHPISRKIQAAWFFKERREALILDESIRADFDSLTKLHRGDLKIVSRDDADTLWLVNYNPDDGPIPYYLWNRRTQTGKFLFYHRPELNDYVLAQMEPISFAARDSLTIHGYITYPPGKSRRGLPMVVLVHGGPWARDYWGFNIVVQWLANRGYAVLQVNYRGSTGYGKDFLNAGNREWGGKMLDDVVDGTNWAVRNGIADSRRIAVYGASFGGYTALCAATFTPEVFCCAVAASGMSNLVGWVQSLPPYWQAYRQIVYKRVGNPETDSALLKSRSPLFRADRIKIPMLIAQGANDPRVRPSEAEQIVAELKENQVEHTYLLFPDEGHFFYKEANRIRFYTVAEEFLAKHLGGRVEVPETAK